MRPAPRVTRWPIALALAGSMVIVPLLALAAVDEAEPTRTRVVADVAAADAELAARTTLARASRAETAAAPETTVAPAESTTTTAAPAAAATTTTAHAHPTTTTAHLHAAATSRTTGTAKATTTTAKPTTTTTARPTTTTAKPATTTTAAPTNSAEGEASWYDTDAGVCAHRTLPFGTVVTVTNLSNGKQVTCRVGDRGPFTAGRIIDLSRTAFSTLAPVGAGVIRVRIEW